MSQDSAGGPQGNTESFSVVADEGAFATEAVSILRHASTTGSGGFFGGEGSSLH